MQTEEPPTGVLRASRHIKAVKNFKETPKPTGSRHAYANEKDSVTNTLSWELTKYGYLTSKSWYSDIKLAARLLSFLIYRAYICWCNLTNVDII